MIYVAVFFAYVALDYCWSKYTKMVGQDRALAAANWAVALLLIGAFGLLGYVQNHWLLVPAALGSWVGTYYSLRGSSIARIARQVLRMEVPPWRPGMH